MQTAMGIDKDVQRKDVPFGQWLENAMRSCFIRMVKILYYPDFIFYRTRMGKLLKKYTYKINKFTEEIIQEKRRKFKEDLDNNEYRPVLDEGSTRPIGKKVFLDFLLELDHKGMNFTDKDLRDEVNTFFVGGTDTSAVTACFFLTMMGMHQDIQEKVYEEVMGVLGPEGQPTVKDLNEMHFFERCLKETMRLFTPAPIILRKNTGGDLKISDGVIPVGASIAICFFYIHRSDLYWNNPLKFDPDRFLPEEMAKRHPYTFLPFSAGFRGCIGQRFALLNLKTQLSLIMRKYRIYCDAYKSVEEIQLKSVLVLRPIHGFKFRLVKRQQ
ncbi:cytochrome P450 4C1-like isoform X2 [Harmonia axyridis]|nr:cytochrome P450 4C1-like isoform X2 [Harmonia axyridis]